MNRFRILRSTPRSSQSGRAWLVAHWAGAVVCSTLLLAGPARAEKPQYNRDIRPILAETCFQCHGPDSAARKADLRLDQREAAIKGGTIVPGKPDESEMIRRICSEDPEEVMPPAKTKKKLTDEQKRLLRQWIADGAEYQLHWSLLTPSRPQVPAVRRQDWCRNAIDHFVLAKLEERGLQPAPEADRRTLARRLSLDLTGLPPTPAMVEAFVNDSAPDAYEQYVDRLLTSKHWGEHRARYWLDAARYADTHGIHFDNFREVWSYRDWVINAFNRNLPFDQFTIEQLAGDLLPDRTLDQQIASGFNRCNITTNEGGAISEEYLVLYTRDRTETASQVFLGLTAGCAVCHDHKFDPLSQREFYSLSAFFNNTTQGAMDGNIKETPPVIVVPQLEERDRWKVLGQEVAAVQQQSEARKAEAKPKFDAWLKSAAPGALASLVPGDGLKFSAPLGEGEGDVLYVTVDGQPRDVAFANAVAWDSGHVGAKAFQSRSEAAVQFADVGNFEKDQSFSCGVWVKVPKAKMTGSIVSRMDDQHDHRGWDLWCENGRLGAHFVHKWPENAIKVLTTGTPIKPGVWTHVALTYDGSSLGAGLKIYVNGQSQPTTVTPNALKDTIRTEVPFKLAQRNDGGKLEELRLQDLRIYGRSLSSAEVTRVAQATRAVWLASKPAAERSEDESKELYGWWISNLDSPFREISEKLARLEQEQAGIKGRGTVASVAQERTEPALAYVLYRGDYDKRRDEVKPETPAVMPPMLPELPRNRLGFAQWLLRSEHPLTSRVTVNRFWQEIFGSGIVNTAGDFGVTGEVPSHPELLDWLAVEFRESGWDIKKFFKLIVTSATYRQAALSTPDRIEKDPHNRLLSRGPRFRMDAEMIRDYALAASGLLSAKVGGPSVKPYQPEGVWEAVAMIGSNTRDYKADSGENLYRRSMYTFWKRSAPPASMDIFNAPSREVCMVRRERTNTPLQALVTLNDPQFIEAARHLAASALQKGGETTESRLDFLAQRLLSRSFRPEENRVVQSTLNELLGFYRGHPDDAKVLTAVGESKADASIEPPVLAAWTMLANELFNLDEVLNK